MTYCMGWVGERRREEERGNQVNGRGGGGKAKNRKRRSGRISKIFAAEMCSSSWVKR